jgi:signal transduction histidine kinase
MSYKSAHIADLMQSLKAQVIKIWREQVRRDDEYAVRLRLLDDKELEDHLPALTEDILKNIRGISTPNIEEDGRRHGRQRRVAGYSIIEVLRELQIWREILLETLEQTAGKAVPAQEIAQAGRLIRNLADRSTNASVEQYLREAETERNTAQGEAKELHGQRDRFLVTLSHELRNQISPILLAVQLLKDVKKSDPRLQQAVTRIERQARHQSALIDDLLDISRFRYGKINLRPEMFDLRQAIEDALETFEPDFQSKPLKLELELPGRTAECVADRIRIVQVLSNLLSNAIKFTPPNGTIRVQLARADQHFLLRVRDTGTGIEQEFLPRMFDMFFQPHTSAGRVANGLGVGLALVKGLVEMHGGSVRVNSEGVGKGAEFTIQLPIAPDSSAEQAQRRRVLLVEDNLDQLAGLADLLKVRGYEVLEARDGFEALDVVSQQKPDVCVIDIGLPGMDGYQVARRLREIPETRDCRLIAVTGYGLGEDRQAFTKAGFDHYLPKPTNVEELTRILAER